MANFNLFGQTFNNVNGFTFADTNGTDHTFTEGGSATLITKDIYANGTYNASSDSADGYSSVTVSVSGGSSIDIPTFDIAWDSSYTTATITCDETFAECWNRYYGGVDRGAYIHIHDTGDWEDNRVAVPVDGVGNDYVTYVVSGAYGPEFDIIYYANGTISRVEPSTYSTTLTATANGEYWPTKGVYSNAIVNVSGGGSPNLQNKTVSPSESQQSVQADSGYDGLDTVTVNAISSTYVGSGITRRSNTDLTASGATVTVPSGYYSTQVSKDVTSGTAGTPTATKGSVSNHSVSVTPSVTNTTGYITGGTKTGTAVTVSASELVSGSETKTENGTYNVTNLASLVVSIPFVTYYTGSTNPASSLGSNGDIYLKVVS